MTQNISVPDIGDFKDVEVIEVLVKPGDKVSKNDPIVTIESDKSSLEIPSPSSGEIKDLKVKIGDNSYIKSFTHIEGAKIEKNVTIGPYARIREGTVLKTNSKIGNFVETKKSNIGNNSKVNHLSYVGDTSVGKNSNIGAGTITCNYDGIKKSKTKIADNVFIGSNSSLVAPVNIGKNSVVGAGSVITKNVKKKSLALTRASQISVTNYKRKKK